MTEPSSSKNTLPLSCSLSGIPTLDPVLTPSGRICDKSLLLAKLSSTNNIDPFDSTSRTIIDPQTDLQPISHTPPKPPSTLTSFPLLLQKMQSEAEGLLLELYDTRKVLEETRRELSLALYQNDAAVRVIARVSMERDKAREEIATLVAEMGNGGKRNDEAGGDGVESEGGGGGKKRKIDDSTAAAGGAVTMEAPAAAVVEDESKDTPTPSSSSSSIPSFVITDMVSTWKTLSKSRRKRSSIAGSITAELVSRMVEVDKKSWHKARSRGVNAIVALGEDYIVTGGTDKTAVVYDCKNKTVKDTLCNATKGIISLASHSHTTLLTASLDGIIRLYDTTTDNNDDNTLQLSSQLSIDDTLLSVTIQPTGRYFLAASPRKVVFGSITNNDHPKELATFESSRDGVDVTCCGLHPDGLIMATGGSDGSVTIWDLKTQSVASTLTIPNDDNTNDNATAPVSSLAFSENGYHFATTHKSTAAIWDLRKLKMLALLRESQNDDDDYLTCVSFDPSGKFLAIGGSAGVTVVVVKDWERRLVTLNVEKGVQDLLWRGDGIVTVGGERVVRFWGLPSVTKEEEETEDVEMTKVKEEEDEKDEGESNIKKED